MTNTSPETKTEAVRPQFRVWLVQEHEEGKTTWTEVSGLWPNKSGQGFHSEYRDRQAIPMTGRIVVLPATFKDQRPAG